VWSRVPGPGAPLDLLHARIVRPYARHIHGQYAIGVCTAGREEIHYRGGLHRAWPGTVVALEPGEVHGGGPAVPAGFRYRVLYPDPEVFGPRPPHFRDPVLPDPELATRLRVAHRELSSGDRLEGETRLVAVLADLVERHAGTPRTPRDPGGPDRLLARRVRERLGDSLADPPSLAEIAAELGVSRYRLVRAFNRDVGLPPYAWLAQHRVDRARRLLERGARPAEAAAGVGFADQAHLTRWFHRVVGVTPAAYRAGVARAAGSG
jgi:AraC-like DNA-binding protein